jgi:hypothetical protein
MKATHLIKMIEEDGRGLLGLLVQFGVTSRDMIEALTTRTATYQGMSHSKAEDYILRALINDTTIAILDRGLRMAQLRVLANEIVTEHVDPSLLTDFALSNLWECGAEGAWTFLGRWCDENEDTAEARARFIARIKADTESAVVAIME